MELKNINYFLFVIKSALRYKKELACVDKTFEKTFQLSLSKYKENGIKALAIDFDGVLANHNAKKPLHETEIWLQNCVEIFGKNKIFIWSNKPSEIRISYFNEHFPDITFISGFPKKPYTDGLKHISEITKLSPKNILVIDDRLLTGILAGTIFGAKTVHIKNPYISLKDNFLHEMFFIFLRKIEIMIISLLNI